MPWFNPKYARPEQPQPPIENGERLATFPRGGGAELRINLSSYEGRPFLSFRIWESGTDGQMWPTKKGVTVRCHEIGDVIAALQSAEGLLEREAQEPRRQPPAPPPGHRPSPRPDRSTGRVDDMTAGPDDHPKFVERRHRPQPRRFDPDDIGDTRHTADFDELGGSVENRGDCRNNPDP